MICPYCEKRVSHQQFLTDNPHCQEGVAILLCDGCSGVSVIDGNSLRLPTQAEVLEIRETPELWQPISEYLAGKGKRKAFAGYKPEGPSDASVAD